MRGFACTLVLTSALLFSMRAGFAAGNVDVSTTILDAQNQPVRGARVEFSGVRGTKFSGWTDRHGQAVLKLPSDTYTIVATHDGYAPESLTAIDIESNTDLSMTLEPIPPTPRPVAQRATPTPPVAHPSPAVAVVSAPAARPTPVPVVRPTPQPVAISVAIAPEPAPPQAKTQAALAHEDLLAAYDARHPEHRNGEPYFGRYTYVLLSAIGPSDPRNRTMVATLLARYNGVSEGGSQAVTGNPFGYNIFFLPVTGGAKGSFALATTVDGILAQYDYAAASYLRARYCGTSTHATTSFCSAPASRGPVMLTLTRPLQGLRAHDSFPATFAYDFSAVAPDRYPTAVALIARAAIVPEPVRADVELPSADLVKYVAPAFVASGVALRQLVPELKVSVDSGLLG